MPFLSKKFIPAGPLIIFVSSSNKIKFSFISLLYMIY